MIDLRQGDCLEVMRDMPNKSVDLTVTSPPYDNLRTYNGNIDQWNFEKFKAIARELYRVTKDGGVVVWIVADATIKGSETGTSFRQALYFKECGFCINDTMIWSKCGFTAVGALKKRYAQTFEYMFILSKGVNKTFNPIKDRKNKHAGTKKHGTIRQKDGTTRSIKNRETIYDDYGIRFNVWEQSKAAKKEDKNGHPAPFPLQLAIDHILSWSNEGDTVLDCFLGSGTTGAACVKTNRNFIGIEIDKNYFEISKNRINETIKIKER